MALTLISVESDYLVQEDESGEEILTTLGPVFHPLARWEDFDLNSAWFSAVQRHTAAVNAGTIRWTYRPDRDAFVTEVRRGIADMDDAAVVWCEDCEGPAKADEAESVRDGYACSSCYEDNYRSCDDCGDTVHNDNTYYTLSDSSVCDSCSDRNYAYCEECDGYYHGSCSDEHLHDGCDCAPPTLTVAMPNGGTVLTEDDRVTISLPSGVISEEGMNSIARLIRDHAQTAYDAAFTTARVTAVDFNELYADPNFLAADAERTKWWSLSHDVSDMDPKWQTKEGNFTKRLSKLAHKSQGLKFPADLLTKVGNVARDNSNGAEIDLELTRDLNLPAEDFYHEDSCWWQSYSDSRCALKSNGGIGMRTFSDNGMVSGRAWVMPLRLDEFGGLGPTFDAQAADAYMVFNGYGDLSGYIPARIVASMTGMTYRKIGFDCSPMYVNNSSGCLVASEEIAARYQTLGRLNLDVDAHSNLYRNEHAARELVAA